MGWLQREPNRKTTFLEESPKKRPTSGHSERELQPTGRNKDLYHRELKVDTPVESEGSHQTEMPWAGGGGGGRPPCRIPRCSPWALAAISREAKRTRGTQASPGCLGRTQLSRIHLLFAKFGLRFYNVIDPVQWDRIVIFFCWPGVGLCSRFLVNRGAACDGKHVVYVRSRAGLSRSFFVGWLGVRLRCHALNELLKLSQNSRANTLASRRNCHTHTHHTPQSHTTLPNTHCFLWKMPGSCEEPRCFVQGGSQENVFENAVHFFGRKGSHRRNGLAPAGMCSVGRMKQGHGCCVCVSKPLNKNKNYEVQRMDKTLHHLGWMKPNQINYLTGAGFLHPHVSFHRHQLSVAPLLKV